MNKFKELLFLKNINGLGKVKINKNYLHLLNEFSDLDDLISEMEFKFKFEYDKLENAKIKAEETYEKVINNPKIQVITIFDVNYPKKLLEMGSKKPLILYVMGNVEALSKPNIAVIGTRKPSGLSKSFEENLVKNIVNSSERAIISGLALGCDKIAHQTTVDESKITIAVLPGDVNKIKPASNKNLAEDILKTGGCLISEYEPGIRVQKGNYVERDKIMAALSDAIFVVECGVESGTMHTVNFAKEYKRQIYSYLPDERPEGSYDGNEFILNENFGAVKVEDIEEFIENLKTLNVKKQRKTSQPSLYDFSE